MEPFTKGPGLEQIRVPVAERHHQFTVKGSKFIGALLPVSTEDEARETLDRIRRKYHDATHNCYAWRIHPDLEKASDDGEPSGSAGRPILQTIQGSGLTNVLVVVTRYFGGTKLGVGGLVRAYTDSARQVLEQTRPVTLVSVKRIRVRVTFAESAIVYQLVDRLDRVRIESEDFDESGAVFSLKMVSDRVGLFREQLRDMVNREPDCEEVEEILDQI